MQYVLARGRDDTVAVPVAHHIRLSYSLRGLRGNAGLTRRVGTRACVRVAGARQGRQDENGRDYSGDHGSRLVSSTLICVRSSYDEQPLAPNIVYLDDPGAYSVPFLLTSVSIASRNQLTRSDTEAGTRVNSVSARRSVSRLMRLSASRIDWRFSATVGQATVPEKWASRRHRRPSYA